MYSWRGATILGIIFAAVGIAYFLVQGSGLTMDRSGAALLVILGIAMTFTFTILLRGSREL